ncbi:MULTISPECIES: winged helix-turn-helix transcriptional regulator [Chryseobacterium]|uniref:DNA-binding HxlR family transcriptional regulator n=1 Tax=Chryseobacterium camelliae TaxID=1265445 RepID=A0ABU0THU5_9FLAO|nr:MULTISPECIES: winged helix-turn-helix transcriptional regulator [Chryseobacterium]MDT3409508.1 DNA-binding HxlR family transcriptional regulator [Pseudacidovorax intermedius]MDQ1096628.1 DNA-binding HxlR family transcriptional regulator [Chryseobacterium camelliae]MDQ1100570.1 DNA-binding HxlR family transcriptional regulator [Chryseobacterium sp. SORGH_AS_1048]MDR6087910.1 DNA-binding HxlR family transcriptional regulator [Chryseobacterium sp. SORGH_AS_0909]MDR6132284.1 DNA-binding HxlR fa
MEKKIKPCIENEQILKQRFIALRDTLDLLSGKWRFSILLDLHYHEKLRFKDFFKVSEGISPKVLSSELSLLESHRLIEKKLEYTSTQDITYYVLTEHAQEIWVVLNTLIDFGLSNREQVIQSLSPGKVD